MFLYQSYNDQQLVRLLRTGDQTAFEEIYKRYHGLLFSHACRRLSDQQEAGDLVQDLFMYLWTNREQLPVSLNLSSYLYASVRNRILNAYRNQKVRDTYLQSLQRFVNNGQNITDEAMRHKELIRLVEQEIAALPPKMRLIFEMSRKLEMSHPQIADELDISQHTVRTQVRSALRILRAKLGENIFLLFF